MTLSKNDEMVFLQGYKDAVFHFNLLEHNMAYCLWWARKRSGKEIELTSFMSKSYDQKFKKVKSLINSMQRENEYSEFLEMAENCRLLRNKLVHGVWEFIHHLEKPIRFYVPHPFKEEGYLSQNEFLAEIEIFERTNLLFCKLRELYPIENGIKT